MATTARRKTTTEKGLGWRHQQRADALKRQHRDGTPCGWCGKPMYRLNVRNWDYDHDKPDSGKLQADHGAMTRAAAIRQGLPIPLPDRLLHARCNQQRGDGVNDHLAAANRDTAEPAPLMTWPWS
jgi:hypothetical protein